MLLVRRLRSFNKISSVRAFRHTASLRSSDGDESSKKDISSSIATKFQVFKNDSVGIIFDVEEERARRLQRLEEAMSEEVDEREEQHEELPSIYANINLNRGTTGVFDIQDLVELLKRENAIDLCVIKISPQLAYVDYMVITTGTTHRHRVGMANFIRKVFKLKRHKNDQIPKIEGENCNNWIAMDLGNIALHIFSQEGRDYYNLESLWLLGEEYEKKVRNRDAPDNLYQQFFNPPPPSDVQPQPEQQDDEQESVVKS